MIPVSCFKKIDGLIFGSGFFVTGVSILLTTCPPMPSNRSEYLKWLFFKHSLTAMLYGNLTTLVKLFTSFATLSTYKYTN